MKCEKKENRICGICKFLVVRFMQKVLGPLEKIDSRSESYKFVGYTPLGYRLWDSKKRKITQAHKKSDLCWSTDHLSILCILYCVSTNLISILSQHIKIFF